MKILLGFFQKLPLASFKGICLSLIVLSHSLPASENIFFPSRHSLDTVEYNLECIHEAQQSIEMFLCLAGGHIFKQLLDACEERIEVCPEIQVYVLASPMLFKAQDFDAIARLETKYPQNFHFQYSVSVPSLSHDYSLNDLHIKGVVVDETYFSFGGTNFHDHSCTDGTYTPNYEYDVTKEMLPIGMRDYDVIGKGPLARDIRLMFYKQYALWEHYKNNPTKFIVDPDNFSDKNAYKAIDMTKPVAQVPKFDECEDAILAEATIIFGGPLEPMIKKSNLITDAYAKLVSSAQYEIVVGNLYSHPAPLLQSALMSAVNRGIEFTLITNGKYPDAPQVADMYYMANRIHYIPFFYGKDYGIFSAKEAERDAIKNTKIFEYQVPKVSYHKKVMVVDKRFLVIGSYNFGKRSDLFDFEGIIVIDSKTMALKTLEVFEEDKKYSVQVTPKEARDWYFNPFFAYLAALQKQYSNFL